MCNLPGVVGVPRIHATPARLEWTSIIYIIFHVRRNFCSPVGFLTVPLIAVNEQADLSLSEQVVEFIVRGCPSR